MKVFFISIISLMIFMLACGTARRSEPLMGTMNTSSEKIEKGRIVFNNKCNKCHPGGESGEGPMLNNIYLPKFVIKARVRSKAFLLYTGKMPSFKKHEISKEELNALTAYLKALRRHDEKKADARLTSN